MSESSNDAAHRNLMVNYLPSSWTNVELQQFFSQFGPLEECRVIIDKSTNTSKGYGFVKFMNRTDAEGAILQVHGMQIEGKQLKVQKAEVGKSQSMPPTLYLAGFDTATFGLNELRTLFAPHGTVTNVKVHNSQPGKKGVAFVTMETWQEAASAADSLNGVTVGADTLTVRIAEASSRHSQPGGQQKHSQNRNNANNSGGQRGGYQQSYNKRGNTSPQFPMQPQVLQPQLQPTADLQQYLQYQPVFQYQPQMQRANVVAPVPGVPGAGGASQNNYCIFVYGVKGMDDGFLWKLFGQFGTVSSVRAPEGKNYGFVNMPNYMEAVNAINILNGAMLQGATVPLQVSFKDQIVGGNGIPDNP